jgi:hypothetical protein
MQSSAHPPNSTDSNQPNTYINIDRQPLSIHAIHHVICRNLVQEGHVAKVRVFGPEKRAAMVALKESAPGGERLTKVRRARRCLFSSAGTV